MNMPRPDKPISKHPDQGASGGFTAAAAWAVLLILLCLVKGSVVFARDNTVTDHRGRTLVVETPFTRIISLYGAHTENLFYLGARDNTLGVSVNDTYPEAVKTKQRFSYHDDPEKFMAVKPDLVLIRPMIENGYRQFVRQLQSYGITVLSFQPATIADVYNYWLNLGILTGRQSAAKTLVARFQDAVREIQQATAQIPHRKKVYFQAIHTRMRTFTPGAMPIFALETAGGINVAADARASRNTNIAVYGKEQILAKADTIDVFLAQKGIMNPVSKADILEEPGFHIIKAVKNNQVYLIEESIVSRPVPRLYQGITAIGRLLYPEIFNSIQTEEDFL